MAHLPPNQRVWFAILPMASGRIGLRLSLHPPEMDGTMAMLVARGMLPQGWPVDVDLVSDPAEDPTLRGPAGVDGKNGAPGRDGSNGRDGIDGASAYQLARAAGYGGTQTQWQATLQGAAGDRGPAGKDGIDGARGPAGPSGATFLGAATIAQTAVVALAAGVRTVTLTGVTGVVAGDAVLLFPTAPLPAGYALHGAVATATGTLVVTMTAPLLAIGASYSIPVRVAAIR